MGERVKEEEKSSAIQQFEKDFGIPVITIAKMENLITFVEKSYDKEDREELLANIKAYRERFGV
ncbi:unnamed protein product [Effrenium voratum]|nr:unnamed protein product [Effrenium voratum]